MSALSAGNEIQTTYPPNRETTNNPNKKGSRGKVNLPYKIIPIKTEFTQQEKLIALQYIQFISAKNSDGCEI